MTLDIARLNEELEGQPLERILTTVTAALPEGRVAVSSAFGPGSLVVMHALHGLGIRLPVLFVDTLHHFPETLELVERVTERYDLDVRVFRPAATREEFEERYGPRLWERDLDRYQDVSKVEPFRRATEAFDGWFTGRRRHQSQTRADLPVIEPGEKLKVNPLATWSKGDVWRFILDNDIPYNPLHDRGYPSIGDEPLTTAVGDGEDERAGRWRGLDRTECGIHTV